MRLASCFGLVAALLAPPAAPQEPAAETDHFLALGIRQVGDGNFEDAVFSLDTAVRNLSAEPGRTRELAQAYVYLGAAYVGLDHEDAAKGKFRKALELDPALRLSPDQFPAKVIKVFDEQVVQRTAVRKRHGAKVFLILGGVGAAVAVGISAASRETALPPNRSPTGVGIAVTPAGQAIPGVTVMTLSATGADPDGDVLTFRWDLGDGAAAEGVTVDHRYESEGTFRIGVTASDGRGAQAFAAASVVARSLTGAWSGAKCVQAGSRFECRFPGSPFPDDLAAAQGILSHPRRADLDLIAVSGGVKKCSGEFQSNLDCLKCLGQIRPFVLTRGEGCK